MFIPWLPFLCCLYESTGRAIAVTMASILMSDVGIGVGLSWLKFLKKTISLCHSLPSAELNQEEQLSVSS